MFKNILKVAAASAVLAFSGAAFSGTISASSSGTTVSKQAAKQAKKALKAYKKCIKRANKGKVSAASCGGSSASYSLVSPVTAAASTGGGSGPSCTVNCTSTLAVSQGEGTPLAVPEPTTLALLGAGLLGMGLATRRRRILG